MQPEHTLLFEAAHMSAGAANKNTTPSVLQSLIPTHQDNHTPRPKRPPHPPPLPLSASRSPSLRPWSVTSASTMSSRWRMEVGSTSGALSHD